MTYDINTVSDGGERRLARVAAVCERFGTRVQFSVFECRLSDTAVQRLMTELLEVYLRRFPKASKALPGGTLEDRVGRAVAVRCRLR